MGAGSMRRLLNTEKLMFTAPEDVAMFCSSFLVEVTAQSEGESWDPGYVPEPVVFNIVLTENFYGLPLNCIPHVVTVILLVIWIIWAAFSKPPRWPASILLHVAEHSEEQGLKRN